MALKKDYATKFGITVPDAYIVIDAFMFDKKVNLARVMASVYASEQARNDGMPPIAHRELIAEFPYKEGDGDEKIIQMGYEVLKLMPELSGAEDV
jgi:hypothetical protein